MLEIDLEKLPENVREEGRKWKNVSSIQNVLQERYIKNPNLIRPVITKDYFLEILTYRLEDNNYILSLDSLENNKSKKIKRENQKINILINSIKNSQSTDIQPLWENEWTQIIEGESE